MIPPQGNASRDHLSAIQPPGVVNNATPAVAYAAPLLVGKYAIEGNMVIWSGRWGMNESAFEGAGLTSRFEMKSSVDETQVAPFNGVFNGFFEIAGPKGIDTIAEKGVEIRFAPNTAEETNLYQVEGDGTNKYGKFKLQGTYAHDTAQLRLYKVYLPKAVKAKPVKRGRTPKAKKTPKAVVTPAPRAAAPVKAVLLSSTPVVQTPASRKHSERKRILPAHLREDMARANSSKLPVSLKKCAELLNFIKANQLAHPFLHPVDPVALNLPTYHQIITNPMDLTTVESNLAQSFYTDPYQFAGHVRLTFNNGMTFNAEAHMVHIWAKKLLELFNKKFKNVEKFHEKQDNVVESGSEKGSKVKKLKTEKNVDGTVRRKSTSKKVRKTSTDETSEMALMKAQIEMMKAQIEVLHRTGNTPTGTTPVGGKLNELTPELLHRAMTFEEKRELSMNINRLPEGKLGRVLQIISERVPLKPGQQRDDEIEIDINSFDTPTLRELQHYVRVCFYYIYSLIDIHVGVGCFEY